MSVFALLMGKSWEDNLSKQAIRLGRASGARGLPTADTPPYDQGETEVRNQIQRKLLDLQQTLSRELQRSVPEITRKNEELSDIWQRFESRQPLSAIPETLDAVLENRRLNLSEAFFRRQQAEGAYNKFRLDHDISILPDHPTDRLNYLSVVFVLLAVETVLNSYFWGTKFGDDFVRGIAAAAAISALNIGLGLAAGVALSYKNLAEQHSKILGWVGCIALLGCCMVVNWYAIASRHVATDNPNESGFGWSQFVGDTNNILMFAIAMIFAIIATYKGYRLFGSIPGYESASKTFLTANLAMESIIADVQSKISQVCTEQIEYRNSLIRRVADVKKHMAGVDAALKQLSASYSIAVQHLNGTLSAVVGLYRQNNLATKANNTPSPGYFNDPVEKFGTDAATLIEALENAGAVASRATMIGDDLQKTATEEVSSIQSTKASYLGERLTGWKLACETEGSSRFLATLRGIGNQGHATG